MRNLMKRSLLGGDFNFRLTHLKGDVEKANRIQTIVYYFICDNGYSQVVSGPPRRETLFDINCLESESSLISCNILPGISDHNGFNWK